MNGRIYDPLLGRFLSADLMVPHPGNLQSYNRYSYVGNNPLSLVDPSGFEDWTPDELARKEKQERDDMDKGITRLSGNSGSSIQTPEAGSGKVDSNLTPAQQQEIATGITKYASEKHLDPGTEIVVPLVKDGVLVGYVRGTVQAAASLVASAASASCGQGNGGPDGNYHPDRIVKGDYILYKKAALLIASPVEEGGTIMRDAVQTKLRDKASFLFDVDAWKASGLSVQSFLADKLKGRRFCVGVLYAHGGANGRSNTALRSLFDARTEEGHSFLGALSQYLNPRGELVLSTCFGQISDAEARADAALTKCSVYVPSNGRVYPGAVELEPTTNNDELLQEMEQGYWKVYDPK
jgi:hypothetical protein